MAREPLHLHSTVAALHVDCGIKMLLEQCTNCLHSLEKSKVNDKRVLF